MTTLKVYEVLAQRVNNTHPTSEDLISQVLDTAPVGSGVGGFLFRDDVSNASKLVFRCTFHHMNEHGYYDRYTHHSVIATGTLAYGLDVKVTGSNRNDIQSYLGELFYAWLNSDLELSFLSSSQRDNQRWEVRVA